METLVARVHELNLSYDQNFKITLNQVGCTKNHTLPVTKRRTLVYIFGGVSWQASKYVVTGAYSSIGFSSWCGKQESPLPRPFGNQTYTNSYAKITVVNENLGEGLNFRMHITHEHKICCSDHGRKIIVCVRWGCRVRSPRSASNIYLEGNVNLELYNRHSIRLYHRDKGCTWLLINSFLNEHSSEDGELEQEENNVSLWFVKQPTCFVGGQKKSG